MSSLQNIRTREDARSYFSSVCGDVSTVAPEILEQHFLQLEKSDLSDDLKYSMAALSNYVGVAYLDEDDLIKAQKFLELSVGYYEMLEPNDDRDFQCSKTSALLYLNLCLIYSHDQLDKVTRFLHECKSQNLTPFNEALLFLAINELKFFLDTETPKNFDDDNDHIEDVIFYRVHEAYDNLLDRYLESDGAIFGEECKDLEGEDEQLLLVKMLVRREVHIPEIVCLYGDDPTKLREQKNRKKLFPCQCPLC